MRHKFDGRVENFLRLRRHLPFFLGETIIKEDIDMRNGVKRNLLGEMLGLYRIIHINAACLIEQFIHTSLAGTRCGLIGRHHDTPDCKCVMQRLQSHDKLCCRAVRVRNDIASVICPQRAVHRVSIHLRHDQRHIVIHAESRRIVDDDTPGLARLWRNRLGGLATGRKKRDIRIGKIKLVQRADGQHLILAVRHLTACRTR